MFCSKCGKSLPPEGAACPYCGHPIGESRFTGSSYTSAQAHIRPGDDVQEVFTQSYTRTTYTSNGDEGAHGDVDTRTTYRPAYSGGSIPMEYRQEPDAGNEDAADYAPEYAEEPVSASRVSYDGLSDEARSTLAEVERELEMDQLDHSKYEWQPIESAGQAGIHPDISELMESIEQGGRRGMRRRRRAAYDDYASDETLAEDSLTDEQPMESQAEEAWPEEAQPEAEPAAALPVQPEAVAEEASVAEETVSVVQPEIIEDQPEETTEADYVSDPGFDDYSDAYADEEPGVFEDIDEEEFDEMRHSSFRFSTLLKVLAILIVASGVIVGGLMWVRHIQGNTSSAPIENVREDFYNSGIALIKEHAVADQYNSVIQSAAGGDMAGLAASLQTSSAQLDALLPEDATDNEKLLLSALQKIETNIGNCITSDAIAITTKDENSLAQSDERWKVVQDSITMLEAAKSAMELTAIVNGEVVDVLEPTPEPTPEPKVNYNTLSKGDKSDAVFELQNRLYELGFLNDDRDGAYGTKTQTAVKMFQQIAGLPTTGIADEATQEALFAEDAPRTPYAQSSGQ